MRRCTFFFKTLLDPFTVLLLAIITLASIFPAQGASHTVLEWATVISIAFLFFMHGAKLSRQSVLEGLLHWRLHALVFSTTFIIFPLFGWLCKPLLLQWMPMELYQGWMFMCVVPATVQSAIAFTSIARGNIAAAICSASSSSMLGVFFTPLLVNALILNAAGIFSWAAVGKISTQILLPFILGQLLYPQLQPWIAPRKKLLSLVDRSSILLVVYIAFSDAINQHLWSIVSVPVLSGLFLACLVFLATIIAFSTVSARLFGFNREDEITIVFCGSKKSLASGVPIAKVLFAGNSVGLMILPLMIFHQLQLVVCAFLAQNYANRPQPKESS